MNRNSSSAVILVAAAMLLGGCEQACENEVATRLSSPSGRLQAVVFHRGCGATTGFNTQVSVIPAPGSLPNEGGNVLILEGKVEPVVLWVSDSQLSIGGVRSEKAFKKEGKVSGVEVLYQ